MPLQINFQIDLDPAEITLLAGIFGVQEADLSDELSKIGLAALTEYCKMIKGEKVFTRGKDIQEYRLLNLIKHFFDGRIPGELEIAALFQMTATESRSLIRSVTSKYQYELRAIIFETLRRKLDTDALINGNTDFRIPLDSNFYKDEFNKILSLNARFSPIEKAPGTGSFYIIKNAEYAFLCQHFNIQLTVNPY